MTYLGEPIHSIGHRNNTSKHEVAQRGTAVYFLDRNTGWIADNEQHVWSTVDGGSNWSDLGKIAADRISDGDWIMFTDRINGWFMTRSGDLWMTNNAGTSWSQVYQSDDPRNPVLGAEATSFALEIGWMGMTEGYLSRTIDNGRTRKSAKVFGECAVSAIDQISDGSSIAFCAERSQIAFLERNAETWNVIPNSPATDGIGVNSASFPSSSVGWAVGIKYVSEGSAAKGVTLKSTDGGMTWERLPYDFGQSNLKYVKFVDAETGWIVGRSKVFKTVDGGQSWRIVFDANS